MNKQQIFLLAAGGHGSVLLDALLAGGKKVAGILDTGMSVGSTVFDVPVLGNDEWLNKANPNEILLVNGIGANAFKNFRSRLFNTWKQRGFQFLSIQHPSSVIGRDTTLSEGSQIMAGTTLQCRVIIGVNSVINTRASIDHDCMIGAHAFIGPSATLCGNVQIGDHAFIGSGAILLPGVMVGPNAIVGAGSLVTRNVPSGELVIGNPAMSKSRRFS